MYHIIYITNLPAFYKVNLFNRIASNRNLLVIFTHQSSLQRNDDFYLGAREFDYITISSKTFPEKLFFILKLLLQTKYQNLIIGGWDQVILWIAAFISPKRKNALIIESSIHESITNGSKGFFKRIFLSRISKAFVSGKSNSDLVKALGFKDEIIITKGVGIFNIKKQPVFSPKEIVRNFIYVGRLSKEKNLTFLIETFNQLPELNLNIVGFGPEEAFLKSKAKDNIYFLGAIPNLELYKIYQANDVFVLPSISEPWGLVVEEALNNGLPVIVSDHVGCAEEIINDANGLIFKISKPESLLNAIFKMTDIDFYNSLQQNVSKMDFFKIAEEQVNCYLTKLSKVDY